MELALRDALYVAPSPIAPYADCPACGERVIAKCGEIVTWHWAHVADTTCIGGTETPWHQYWKTAVPVERREVSMGAFRADVIAGDDVVCELQHSALSVSEIRRREFFYDEMRWLFDARERDFALESRGSGHSVHRAHGWPTIAACTRRVMLDIGDNMVISLEKVNETGSYGFGYIYPYKTIRMWLGGPSYPTGWRQQK